MEKKSHKSRNHELGDCERKAGDCVRRKKKQGLGDDQKKEKLGGEKKKKTKRQAKTVL